MENPEVTNSGNNLSDPKDSTSRSELNPLQNPKLGQNLGRWAQVYFTNPPEKRDQAVIELLRELEAESSPGETEARMPQLQPNGNPVPHQSAFLRAPVMCRQCHEKNEVGQKFC